MNFGLSGLSNNTEPSQETPMNRIVPMVFAAFIAGCATHDGSSGGNSELEIISQAYREHAGPSRSRVVFPQVESWRSLAYGDIVVRTRADDYYLLTLEPACANDLRFSSSVRLAIAQQTRNTLSRFDTIRAGDSSCRIQTIREIDPRAVLEALEARDIREPFIRAGQIP